jgi:pSer/pThr/pTyr-binding forkhead associated (FHA) protein
MFSLEITFKGDSPSTERIFIRRPLATIGSEESSHVIVDEMKSLGYSLMISRDLGRKFTLTPMGGSDSSVAPSFLDGVYEGEASVDLGPIAFRFVALDSDLMIRDMEAPDRAGARILRQAATGQSPIFPALVVTTTPKTVVSFSPDQPVLVGRSRQCSLRLDNASVSARHARIGFEAGQFWVEDLGSSNGTFVNQQQIAGRVNVDPGAQISFGKEVVAQGVVSAEQAADVIAGVKLSSPKALSKERKYPLLLSLSESARPARMVLKSGSDISIGRDPSSDMWLGAPHVSRKHCQVHVSKTGLVRVTDCSTNGTGYDGGMLRRDQYADSSDKPLVLDFGGGLTVALCFSEKDEQAFNAAQGAATAFKVAALDGGARGAGKGRPRARRTTAWLQVPPEILGQAAGAPQGRGGVRQLFARLSWQGRIVLAVAALGITGCLALVVSVLVMGFSW